MLLNHTLARTLALAAHANQAAEKLLVSPVVNLLRAVRQLPPCAARIAAHYVRVAFRRHLPINRFLIES